VNCVSVDLTDIKVFLDLSDFLGNDAVGNTPYSLRGRIVMVGQLFPVGSLNESDNTTGSFWGASVILTRLLLVMDAINSWAVGAVPGLSYVS
jgi:hypothetical protein